MDSSAVNEKPEKVGITHDTAARLIGITPGELTDLVRDGFVHRNDKNSYSVPVLVGEYCAHLRAEAARQESHPNQSRTAEHTDLSERSIREWEVRLGLQNADYTLTEFRISYIRALREVAAGRAATGDIDLATERALLARAQREGQEIKNAVSLGTYAPIELLSDVLANAAQAMVDRLEQIPADLRRVCPDLPQAARDAVMAEVASARNELVRKTASLLADEIDPADVQDEEDAVDSDPILDEDAA